MVNQAEIVAIVEEKMKEQMNVMNKKMVATTAKMMEDFIAK